jgi:hypothetical protein
VPPKLKLGKPEPAFGPLDAPQKIISQKRLNELVEDWEALYNALLPFANLAETLQRGLAGQLDRRDLFRAKGVLDHVYARLEQRRVNQAQRSLAGNGDVCKLCGSPIDGADDHELLGYCSKTCQREDTKSEWPAPDGDSIMDPMFGLADKPRKP